MSNVQPNSQIVECDDQTAELHMAMAKMMEEEEGDMDVEQGQGNQLTIMQLTVAQENTYGKHDQMYIFQANDFSYYLTSFYNNVPGKDINNVASNVMDVVGTTATLEQNIELAISKIFKNNPQTATMEYQHLIKYLEEELKKMGFDDLRKVNIL